MPQMMPLNWLSPIMMVLLLLFGLFLLYNFK